MQGKMFFELFSSEWEGKMSGMARENSSLNSSVQNGKGKDSTLGIQDWKQMF
ncbi:hypothetical protein C1645_837025 [Glomus cerebriforme]|uniref:Uncharacterized protein n=1 Tax=Glomus cerebriforme TaxID=658196 RepID=A0A397S9C3_9GLOM|nr:hypothetical protein C1645_837025 [Glomus cerebriforme]